MKKMLHLDLNARPTPSLVPAASHQSDWVCVWASTDDLTWVCVTWWLLQVIYQPMLSPLTSDTNSCPIFQQQFQVPGWPTGHCPRCSFQKCFSPPLWRLQTLSTFPSQESTISNTLLLLGSSGIFAVYLVCLQMFHVSDFNVFVRLTPRDPAQE